MLNFFITTYMTTDTLNYLLPYLLISILFLLLFTIKITGFFYYTKINTPFLIKLGVNAAINNKKSHFTMINFPFFYTLKLSQLTSFKNKLPLLNTTSWYTSTNHEATQELLFRKSTNRYTLFFQNFTDFVLLNFERVPYYIRNWVYSTNHKRIAVNYFWFVILAGICGMILATIIRLEMAYPGVGILAGDSLQYLSIVTAHAVIMVFFMVIPLVYGAFGNFLLPTQLGVHDVAFPRLNSAAFWFLPGGLLMLAQLVCLDRRYQRMNCFNIRELQTLLKNRYHPDLLDEQLYTDFLANVSLNTRFKLFDINTITPRMSIFHTHPLTLNSLHSTTEFQNTSPLATVTSINTSIALPMYNTVINYFYTLPYYSILTTLETNPTVSPNVDSITKTPSNFTDSYTHTLSTYLHLTPLTMLNIPAFSVSTFVTLCTTNLRTLIESLSVSRFYVVYIDLFQMPTLINPIYTFLTQPTITASTQLNTIEIETNNTSTFTTSRMLTMGVGHELTTDYRFQKTTNPVFRYDFKVGHYLPDQVKVLNRQLFTTFNDATGGLRKASWYLSPEFMTTFKIDVLAYLAYFSTTSFNQSTRSAYIALSSNLSRDFQPNGGYLATPTPTSGFYTLFSSFQHNSNYLNLRWISLNALDQKFHNMFTSSSMQQRIYANWRQLKFTREAWRCKLLASRHQNTLHRRYIHEDSVVWSVERNAKDLLPGWAMITPFSARTRFTAIGKVDIGLFGVFLAINASIVSSANFLVTYRYLSTLNNRKMRDARSFFSEAMLVGSWMIIAANPMLAIGILMLLADRHWQTSFFDYSGGGDTVLFQHMFWFFGHPEVYIVIIPTFGFNNTILSFYLRKRVSARASLMYSLYTIAFLGFFVWGHHMYMVGLAHTTRMLFSTLTVMISVPAATKLMHWAVTIVNSSLTMELPLLFQFIFIFAFVSGGVSGMCVAHTGMDVMFHDSFYVVGHFHIMFAGSAMYGSFGAFYFYFPAIFGVKFNRIWGYLHLLYFTLGQFMTVIPMLWLGYAGMPRRVLDYPASMGGWHSVASAGHLLSVAAMMAFFIMIFDSMRARRAVVRMTFGVSRFNTRLNFYIYEGARTWFLQRKGWYNARTQLRNELTLDSIPYRNYELFETTLFTYVLVKPTTRN